MNIGEKKMADKFNITGIDVEFQDGLIDELKQKHNIDALNEVERALIAIKITNAIECIDADDVIGARDILISALNGIDND